MEFLVKYDGNINVQMTSHIKKLCNWKHCPSHFFLEDFNYYFMKNKLQLKKKKKKILTTPH